LRVAFIGLGAIGAPMARHLAKEPFQLAVWNRSPAKARAFVEQNPAARLGRSAADAARDAEIVVTCLSTSHDVASILDGPDGLLAGIVDGSVLVDCTSGDPATSQSIAARLAERRIAFLDAPVSGGVSGAVAGTLTIMCGGEPETLERVRPVLEAFGKKIVLCGPVGAGDAVKAFNQAMLAIHIWSAGEGLVTLTKAGVKASVALDVVNASSGRSNASMNLFPERVLTRAFPRTFRLALIEKDIGIAAEMARQQRVNAPLTQLAAELFRIARGELGEEADHVEAVKVLEAWSKVEIA
jgi:3-hydroxyisobutyrate dehydrogenase